MNAEQSAYELSNEQLARMTDEEQEQWLAALIRRKRIEQGILPDGSGITLGAAKNLALAMQDRKTRS